MAPNDSNIDYRIVISPKAKRDLKKLSKKLNTDQLIQIDRKILDLKKDPRPIGCEKLSGDEKYRIRDGDYRILYYIDDRNKTVEIGFIGDRKDIYRH